jgi:hypothetical protein
VPALLIRNERTGAAWRVWPDPEVVPAGAVQETGSYLFELLDAPDASAAELFIDDQPLEGLRAPAATARWRWLPGFHAGTVDAELRLSGQYPLRFEIETDPDIRKLTRTDFDLMVREILEDTLALFAVSSFRRSVARGTGKRPPSIARLEFLRSRIGALEQNVAAIARRPRHMLRAEEATVPYYGAAHATGPDILRSFRTGSIRTARGTPSRLPPSLRGFLPSHLRVQRRRSSVDLPEHRQMGACLRSWSAWISAVADILAAVDPQEGSAAFAMRTAWARRCRTLGRRLARMASQSPFAEAGEAPPRLLLSALFRNDPEYRRFFRLWQDMNLGIASVFGDFLDMPLARTFELDELWCFMRLVRAALEEYGAKGVEIQDLFIRDATGALTIAAGTATVRVGNGWKFCFQKRYREFWIEPGRRGSFSREMTPDIALDPAGATTADRIVVLDAKYRIDAGLTDALNSIHTYRDALVHEAGEGAISGIVGAAYLLTPHVPEIAGAYPATPMPGRLFHPAYRSTFKFGAMSLRPGMMTSELRGAMRALVADAAA